VPGSGTGNVGAVVVAAGRGDRFGAAKQFLVLDGLRLVDHAVATAAAVTDEVVVVLPEGFTWDGAPVRATAVGGLTRSESVRAGLAEISPDVEIVVVHDAARPLAMADAFAAVIDAVRRGADGAVPAVPISDTIKRVDGARVAETVDRDALVAVQTPQAFRASSLRAAHACPGEATDDAALVEAAGGCVVTVPGDVENFKVTTPLDLDLAAVVLARRREQSA
jgi:2-C-methyl-D-erythritol 4-phosphate cytidylyltransferase